MLDPSWASSVPITLTLMVRSGIRAVKTIFILETMSSTKDNCSLGIAAGLSSGNAIDPTELCLSLSFSNGFFDKE